MPLVAQQPHQRAAKALPARGYNAAGIQFCGDFVIHFSLRIECVQVFL
jgi:hypothetical protein